MKKITIGFLVGICIAIAGSTFASSVSSFSLSETPSYIHKSIMELQNQVKALQDAVSNFSLIPGPKGDKGDQGIPGIPGKSLWVIDANEVKVGILTDYINHNNDAGQPIQLYIPEQKKMVSINLMTGKYIICNGCQDLTIQEFTYRFYKSSDCTGQAYSNLGLSPEKVIAIKGASPQFFTPNGPIEQNVVFNSALNIQSGQPFCSKPGSSPEDFVVPIEPITLPTFTGPLHLQYSE